MILSVAMDSTSNYSHYEQHGSHQEETVMSADSSLGSDSGFIGSSESASFSDDLAIQEQSDTETKSQYFDEKGGKLFLPGSLGYLDIPPGALTERQRIHLTLLDPAIDGYAESDTPRITSPVRCEPDGTQFLLPVELVLSHCGIIKDPGSASMEVYTRSHKDSGWVKDEEASSSATINKTTFSIFVRHFSDIDGILRDGNRVIGKLLRVFPTVYNMDDPDDDLIIQLWMCNDQDYVYDKILHDPKSVCSRTLLDSYVTYVFNGSEKPFQILYTNRSEHYDVQNSKVKINFTQLWYGSRCPATIRSTKVGNWTDNAKLKGTLMAQQEDNEEIEFIFQKRVKEFFLSQEARDVHQDPSPMEGAAQHQIGPLLFEMDHHLARKLSDCLDIVDPLGKDWKEVASELGYTSNDIQVFEIRCKFFTYELLINACKSGRLCSLHQLITILKKIKRVDAINIILKDNINKECEVGAPSDTYQEPMDTSLDILTQGGTMGVSQPNHFTKNESFSFNESDVSHSPVVGSTPIRQSSNVSLTSLKTEDSEDSGILSPEASSGWGSPDYKLDRPSSQVSNSSI